MEASLFIFPPALLLFELLSLVRKGCNILLGIFVFVFDQVPIFIIDDSVDLLLLDDDDPTLFSLYSGDDDDVDGIEVSGTEGMELKGLEEEEVNAKLGFFSTFLLVVVLVEAAAAVDDDDIRADFVAVDFVR